MTLALIKLHSVPATPPWWEQQERAHLVAWLHGSTWAPLGCRPSALGNPGKLPGPFVSGSTLETINTAAADGKNPPNAAPSAPLFIQPYGQAQMGGKGAVTGQHCFTSDSDQRPGGQATLPIRKGDTVCPQSWTSTEGCIPLPPGMPRFSWTRV